ncbi:MAG: outer membrane protein assembly factor BamD [Candidatus Auribacterota bacterium]|nr:outer membrane protein assembly factor BamD [Candidatus Auribacterota bacterium]
MKIFKTIILPAIIVVIIAGCGGVETDPLVREEMLEVPDEAAQAFSQARDREEEGDFDRALELYEDLADDYSDSSLAPEALFRIGRILEEQGNYSGAIGWYDDLIDDYPNSDQAPDGLFRMGVCLEEEDDLLDAFDVYQDLLEEYPGKGSLEEILQREFEIGEAFMNGRKKLFLFLRIRSGLGTAEDIFRAIVEKATFSKVSYRAQYGLGRVLQEQEEYEDAISEYKLVLSTYPGAPVLPQALFNLGICYYEIALDSDYDQREDDRALRHLNKYVQRFPDGPHIAEAREKIIEITDQKAEKAYNTAKFYDTGRLTPGAKIYYQEVIDRYPESRYADKARARLEAPGGEVKVIGNQ